MDNYLLSLIIKLLVNTRKRIYLYLLIEICSITSLYNTKNHILIQAYKTKTIIKLCDKTWIYNFLLVRSHGLNICVQYMISYWTEVHVTNTTLMDYSNNPWIFTIVYVRLEVTLVKFLLDNNFRMSYLSLWISKFVKKSQGNFYTAVLYVANRATLKLWKSGIVVSDAVFRHFSA
jgi:hypothetical protein